MSSRWNGCYKLLVLIGHSVLGCVGSAPAADPPSTCRIQSIRQGGTRCGAYRNGLLDEWWITLDLTGLDPHKLNYGCPPEWSPRFIRGHGPTYFQDGNGSADGVVSIFDGGSGFYVTVKVGEDCAAIKMGCPLETITGSTFWFFCSDPLGHPIPCSDWLELPDIYRCGSSCFSDSTSTTAMHIDGPTSIVGPPGSVQSAEYAVIFHQTGSEDAITCRVQGYAFGIKPEGGEVTEGTIAGTDVVTVEGFVNAGSNGSEGYCAVIMSQTQVLTLSVNRDLRIFRFKVDWKIPPLGGSASLSFANEIKPRVGQPINITLTAGGKSMKPDFLGDLNVQLIPSTLDADGDGVPDPLDNCPHVSNLGQQDGDGDSRGDACDSCPAMFNPDGRDTDGDGLGDVCDPCPRDPSNSCDRSRSAAADLGIGGGTLATADKAVELTVPSFALVNHTSVSIVESPPASGGGATAPILTAEIGPADVSLYEPAKVKLSWKDIDGDGVVDGTAIAEGDLVVEKDGTAVTKPCREDPGCDPTANSFEFSTIGFGTFVLGYEVVGPRFRRGDVTADSARDITDGVDILLALFEGKFHLECRDAADVDDSGAVDISDAIRLLGFLFLGGPAPAQPFPDCGADPTDDAIDCQGRTGC